MRAALDKKRFGPWALVTGSSSGIGKEFARQIAASGINIVLVARREDLLKEVGAEFSKRYGVEHRVVVLDVSRENFIGQLASATDDLDIPACYRAFGARAAIGAQFETRRFPRFALLPILKLLAAQLAQALQLKPWPSTIRMSGFA